MKILFALTATLIILVGSVLTGIAQDTIVWEENFDGVPNGQIPEGWTILYNDTFCGDGAPNEGHCDPPVAGWVVTDGLLDSGVGDHDKEALFIMAGGPWGDITVEADLFRFQGTGYMGLAARVQEDGDRYDFRYMTGHPGGVLAAEGINHEREGDAATNPVVLWLVKRVGGEFTVLAKVVDGVPDLARGEATPFKFEVIGNKLKGTAAGVTIEATDTDLIGGAVGFHNGEYGVVFDNVVVTATPPGAVSPKSKLAATWGRIKAQ